jgi:predicted ATPase
MYLVPYRLARAADACRMAGNIDEGVQLISDALEAMRGFEDHWFEADLYRLQGELLLRAGTNPDDAEVCFEHALKVARLQGGRLLELRAAISMTRLWRDQGKHAEARDLLAPVYDWFTEGFDTPDLKEAKALLEELK